MKAMRTIPKWLTFPKSRLEKYEIIDIKETRIVH